MRFSVDAAAAMALALRIAWADLAAGLRVWPLLFCCLFALGAGARPLPEAARPAQLWGGLQPNGVWAIAFVGHDMYVGGTFSEIDGVPAHNIARWDGRAWHSLGEGPDNGVNGTVNSLAVVGKTLYVLGYLDQAGGTKVDLLAVWQEQHWSSLSWEESTSSTRGTINTLLAVGPDLYVGGEFTLAGPGGARNLARWDGRQWHAVGTTLPDALSTRIYTLTAHDELLYAESGATDPRTKMPQLACWNQKTATWHLLPPPPPGLIDPAHPDSITYVDVTGLVATDSGLYMSYRSDANPTYKKGLLRWNGHRWDWLGAAGSSGRGFLALAAAGNDVYVAGNYKQIDEQKACNVTRWANNRWKVLQADFDWDSLITGVVRTVAVRGRTVYAGGDLRAFYITRWNKKRWVKLSGHK